MIGIVELLVVLVVIALFIGGGLMLLALVKKAGGWAVAGLIAAVVLMTPVVLILVAIFSWRAREVVTAHEVSGPPLAVRVEERHAGSVRIMDEAQRLTAREVERARSKIDGPVYDTFNAAADCRAATQETDQDAAAIVVLHLNAEALSEHHTSTGQLAEAIATLCELVALSGDDHPIEVSQLRRIRLAGPDDDPLPLAAVLGDLSRSTNLEAKAAGPRVIRVVASPSSDLGPANADELAAELITHDELVESIIHGTFTQEVSGDTVRLQVYQRESLTDEEQQLAGAALAQIIGTLLPDDSTETKGAADIALLAASETPSEPSQADTEAGDTEAGDTEAGDTAESVIDEESTEEVDTEEERTEDAGTDEASAEEVASGDVQPAEASDENTDDETVDEPVADVTNADELADDKSDEQATADTEPAKTDEVVADAVAEATDTATAEEVESLEAAVAASRAVVAPSSVPPVAAATPAANDGPHGAILGCTGSRLSYVAAVAPAANDGPIEMSPSLEVDTSPERPDWVDDEDELRNDGVYRATVSAGPYETRIECDRALDDEILRATRDYLVHLSPNVGDFDSLDRSYLRSTLVKALWEERRDTSVGPMRIIHARLEFTPDVQHDLQVLTRQRIVNERLAMTGVLSGIVLAVLGTFFGYFKLDTLTKGYYSTRLKLLAGVVILGLLGVLVSLFQ